MAGGALASDKKKAISEGAMIACIDECGVGFDEEPAKTWGKVGHPPVLRRQRSHRGLSCCCVLGVESRTGKLRLFLKTFKGSINGLGIVAALKHLRRRSDQPMIIVWDGLSAHRSRVVREYIAKDGGMTIEELPGYSPELNPEEYCHGYVKGRIRNHCAETVEELAKLVRREFARLRYRVDLLRSFFDHAKIPIINLSG